MQGAPVAIGTGRKRSGNGAGSDDAQLSPTSSSTWL